MYLIFMSLGKSISSFTSQSLRTSTEESLGLSWVWGHGRRVRMNVESYIAKEGAGKWKAQSFVPSWYWNSILKLGVGNMTKILHDKRESFHDNYHNIVIFAWIKLLNIGYTLF